MLAGVLLGAPAAGAASSLSSNWAGYVARPASTLGSRFTSVSGVWRQPAAACSGRREAYSAVWVGLGGDSENARSLEQIGTEADCTSTGHAVYSAWYELVPAPPVPIEIGVRPGEQLTGSVTVLGTHVTLRIRNLTTGARFTRTVRVPTIDASSAEWIVEAPSVCPAAGTCRTLPLANFGNATFASATATAHAHTGTVEDPGWSATEFQLRQGAHDVIVGRSGARGALTGAVVLATPSSPSSAAGAFSVSWREQSFAAEAPSPSARPGFNLEAGGA
jgi:hypothetical protein